MIDRKIAILLFEERKLQNVRDAVSVFMANSAASEITVFSKEEFPEFNTGHEHTACKSEKFPECENPDMEASVRNAILRKYESEGFDGMLHVVSDSIKILKDPSMFMDDLDSMMKQFKYPVWLATVTDLCNRVYGKYNPRLILKNDMPALSAAGIRYGLIVTSHSNTAWMAYDLGALRMQKDIEYFSEKFTIPMFYIVELLARRRERRLPGQPFFMNQYLTVDSEQGVFINMVDSNSSQQPEPEKMQSEDAIFKSMNVKYEPDFSVDAVIDSLVEKILAKTSKSELEKTGD